MEQKPRVIKDYDKLEPEIQEQIKLVYPKGFSRHLIKFRNKDGIQVSALPFETEEKYYLLRMTVKEAKQIIENDDDYDDDGLLKTDILEDYQEKYESEDLDIDEINEDEILND